MTERALGVIAVLVEKRRMFLVLICFECSLFY